MSVSVVDPGPQQISRSVEVSAPATELFAIAADPRRHHELDGSGTVGQNIRTPDHLEVGSRFSTGMRMFGLPYRITSTVTEFDPDKVIEWRHPLGHRWRWEFVALSPTSTRVTETFDFRNAGPIQSLLNYKLPGFVKANAKGIEATLRRLQARYS
ncbi:Possible polyketide cyclase/dehydrase [Mycobacteroides abscessus]|uniref:Possible polyketide cyclase/dehydrase n=5 Tax=Mycobacteroides abscessus TaxID=36809 RepID=A0A0U0ZL98_9MYCO|nr:SRPBCC family protein [Mycobacteroides abscessus]ESV57233.1 polyketide cyclase / dehydrase and lipid transport family protein [Mycobacteroides abscessus MAB_082312_2258]ESV65613.1 polyketide cyclase / dehydrase and lipid transport family protein [Mycobacteroides abscessus MAB_091912_2446]AFN64530.1 dimethyladenosine transferase [Mycobacteroides abscessus subsp. massiliense str. GO 06]AGM31006.1 dimethyladenosine transferase [Mycobacteroides abscessus subsp. bolletii 50594]AMU28078.1 dimethy